MQARTHMKKSAVLFASALICTAAGVTGEEHLTAQRVGAADTSYGVSICEPFALPSNAYAVPAAEAQSSETTYGAETELIKKALNRSDTLNIALTSLEADSAETVLTRTENTTETTLQSEQNGLQNSTDANNTETDGYSDETDYDNLNDYDDAVQPETVVFNTFGYGHGVGMSQNGANFYAMYDGWTYDQILAHYYPGTQLVSTGATGDEWMTVNGKTDTIVSILSQICYNEMGDSFSEEAVRAQAIAAYTFYLYNGCGYGMICKENPPERITELVRSVIGIAVYYDGQPALTSFYASSGGATASCRDIFAADHPYLRSVDVRHDEFADPNYNVTKTFSVEELKNKLETAYDVVLTGNPCEWITLEYGDGGYVAFAEIGEGVRVRGNDLRSALGLRSPKFEISFQ